MKIIFIITPELLNAFIRWIEIVTSMLLYIGETVPEDIRVDLHTASRELISEIRKSQ